MRSDSIDAIVAVLDENDGSLPDIEIDYCGTPALQRAYAYLRSRSGCLNSNRNVYWSKRRNAECEFGFDDDPTQALIDGDAEGFHVVFGAIRSPGGNAVPDLGMGCYKVDWLRLDYRMGPEWNSAAVIGLFELLRDLSSLAQKVEITHSNNIFDEQDALLNGYRRWLIEQG